MKHESEADHKKRICDELRDLGAMIQIIDGTSRQSGYPDRFIIHHRWSGYIEFKGMRGQLRTNQRLILKGISARSFPAIVMYADGVIIAVGGVSGKTCVVPGLIINTGQHVLNLCSSVDWRLLAVL